MAHPATGGSGAVKPLTGEIRVHGDAGELAREAAEDFASLAERSVREQGRFAVALTGGSSPIELYRLLGGNPIADRVPWEGVHLFWGDDRVVPPAHPRSNFRLAERLFISRVGLPRENLHRVRGEWGALRAADAYAEEVHEFFGVGPVFDLVHLGLGGDGHVASLFPFDRCVLLERNRPAVPSLYRALGEWRVTLTFPVLTAARRVEFLIPAADKARIARPAMLGPADPIRLPAQGVRPTTGTLVWRLTHDVLAKMEAIGSGD